MTTHAEIRALKGPPPIVPRPRVALYLWVRGVKPKQLERVCGKGGEQIRRYLLPFGDDLHTPAPRDVVVALIAWSGGEISADDFLPVKPLVAAPSA